MLNCEEARNNLLELVAGHRHEVAEMYFEELMEFVNDVETLLKHNSIKQVPALLKAPK
jgi:hypothetical protein